MPTLSWPGDERRRGLHGPVAVSGVDVGVTEAGRLDPDAHLTELEAQNRHLLDGQRLAEGVHDGGAVGAGREPVEVRLEDGEGHVAAFVGVGQAGCGTGASTRWARSTSRLE